MPVPLARFEPSSESVLPPYSIGVPLARFEPSSESILPPYPIGVPLARFEPSSDSMLSPFAFGVPSTSSHIFHDYCQCGICQSPSSLNPFAPRFTPSLKPTATEFVPAAKAVIKRQSLRPTATPFVTRLRPLRPAAQEFRPRHIQEGKRKSSSLSASAPSFTYLERRSRAGSLNRRVRTCSGQSSISDTESMVIDKCLGRDLATVFGLFDD